MKKNPAILIMVSILLFAASCTTRDATPAAATQSAPQQSEISMPTPEESPSPSPPLTPSQSPKPASSEKQTTEVKKVSDEERIAKIKELPSGSIVDISGLNDSDIAQCFFAEPVGDAVFKRMQGKTFKKNCTTKRETLRYVKVLYTGFDGQTKVGELVVNKSIAKDITEIFLKLYRAAYPIEKMKLEDDYGGDDDASMADNNTSAFNFRTVEGSKTLSKHALGLAIDLNPLYNPYIVIINGKKKVEPPNGAQYADRKLKCPYYIKKGDLCHKLFIDHGFSWGGSWAVPDYQHFSKSK